MPVNVAWHGIKEPAADWLMESKSICPGVVVARTLMEGRVTSSAVRVINLSDHEHRVHRGQFVGPAEPVETEEVNVANAESLMSPTDVKRRSGGATATSVPEHLQGVIDALPADLPEAERAAAVRFVLDHEAVFSSGDFDLGRTHLVKHRIDTGTNRPFKQPLRRHPIAYLPVIDEHVKEMLAHDIIEPAASPYASNVVLVKKRDNSIRFCLDFRQLNEITYKDSYPLPRIDTCLQSISGAKFFSTLDLRAGYWQTEIDERDRDKTAFVTRRGMYRFKVLSFGLANAPALFQRLMDLVLVGLTWECCLVYLDDVIVFSGTFSEHITRLNAVFERFRLANLKLKPSKCQLFQRRVTFLGHVVSEAGVEPEPGKIDVVRTWPVPRSLTQLRSFVGLASYYRASEMASISGSKR